MKPPKTNLKSRINQVEFAAILIVLCFLASCKSYEVISSNYVQDKHGNVMYWENNLSDTLFQVVSQRDMKN